MSYSNKVKALLADKKNNQTEENGRKSFFRELFLSSGNISDPKDAYHLEFVISDEETARGIKETAHSEGIFLKYVKRRNRHVLYLKSSEQIEDFLYYIDAPAISFDLMETKIIKDVRNNINRVTNFESANLGKISNASARQMAAINFIIDKGKFDLLPEELKQTANLRLENIEMSLEEIGEISEPAVSKSGIKHRMQKIIDIAGGLK
jgi:hypothetical protein